jgi:hypothetical protein
MLLSENTTAEKEALINRLVEFIRSVGIDVQEGHTGDATFVPGLEIREGALVVDRKKLSYPGDLLHEAGHIAVTVAGWRQSLNGNVTDGKPEKMGEELAAMLWSYAACIHIGIPPAVVFHPYGYKGDSDWILDNYRKNVFIGMPLMEWMGMAKKDEFPKMIKWLRD